MPLINGTDVFQLTEKGGSELQRANTSLPSVSLEVLLRIDGKATVEQLSQGMPDVALSQVVGTLGALVLDGRISLGTRMHSDALEYDEHSGATAPLAGSTAALKRAERLAADGVSSLQQQGYYVRIARRPAARPKLPTDHKPLVIIIEDEPLLAQFLKHLMGFEGFESRLAANRDEIVRALNEPPPPDLILLDIVLPDTNGFHVLAKIRQHEALRAVPTLLLTAKTTRESVIRGLAGGADGYITKPFQAAILTEAIRTLFGISNQPEPPGWGA